MSDVEWSKETAHLHEDVVEKFQRHLAVLDETSCIIWAGPYMSRANSEAEKRMHGGQVTHPIGRFAVQKRGKRYYFQANRFAYNLQHHPNERSPLTDQDQVINTCGNSECLIHNYVGDQSEANRSKGGHKGNKNKRKLTDAQYLEIQARAANGETHPALALEFFGSKKQKSTIWYIVNVMEV